MFTNDKIVSFDNEPLIVVNEHDEIIGYKSKADCHEGNGILHRAFSIFIFNKNMQLLIQKMEWKKDVVWKERVILEKQTNSFVNNVS